MTAEWMAIATIFTTGQEEESTEIEMDSIKLMMCRQNGVNSSILVVASTHLNEYKLIEFIL
jgi:hypothetical protein